jgi:hypothetical protein
MNIMDAQGNAGAQPINGVPAAGNILGAANAPIINTNGGAATISCDGGNSNWNMGSSHIAGTASTSGANKWTGANPAPPCPLTYAATIAISATSCAAGGTYGVGTQFVTLTGNATLPLPTGLTDGQVFEVRIAQDATGGRVLTPAAAYIFPGGNFQQSLAAGAVDKLVCEGFGGTSPNFTSTEADCGPVAQALSAGWSYTITSQSLLVDCVANAFCVAGPINATAGHTVVVITMVCGGSAGHCALPISTTILVPTKSSGAATIGTCVLGANTTGNNSFALTMNAYLCPVTGTGALTMQANVSVASAHTTVSVFDLAGVVASPDDGAGAQASGTASPATVTSAATSQASEFVLAAIASTNSTAVPGTSAGYTVLGGNVSASNFVTLIQWKVGGPAGTQTFSSTVTPASGNDWQAFILPMKHP